MSAHANRTLFYGQQLMGLGGGQVESLRSYVLRLALEHCLTPHKLMEELFERYPLCGRKHNIRDTLATWDIQTQSEYGVEARERFEAATGVALHSASIARFAQVLSPLALMRSGDWLYCPHCLADVESVVACPIHGTFLLPSGACGEPHLRLPPQCRVSLSTACATCGADGFSCMHTSPIPASQEDVLRARMVEGLLSRGLTAGEIFTAESLRCGLRDLVAGAFNNVPVRASIDSGLARACVRAWLLGENRPSLDGLLKLCIRSGGDLAELVCGRFVQVRDPVYAERKPRPYKRVSFSSEVVRAQLLESAESSAPRTLASFAQELDVDPTTLKRMFTQECAALVAAGARARRIQLDASFNDSVETFKDAALRLGMKGIPLAEKYVQREANLAAFFVNHRRRRALAEGIRLAQEVLASNNPQLRDVA
jgi:hypothetical protein